MNLLDLPGMFDTKDSDRTDQYKESESLKHLKKITDFVKKETNNKLHYVLFVVAM